MAYTLKIIVAGMALLHYPDDAKQATIYFPRTHVDSRPIRACDMDPTRRHVTTLLVRTDRIQSLDPSLPHRLIPTADGEYAQIDISGWNIEIDTQESTQSLSAIASLQYIMSMKELLHGADLAIVNDTIQTTIKLRSGKLSSDRKAPETFTIGNQKGQSIAEQLIIETESNYNTLFIDRQSKKTLIAIFAPAGSAVVVTATNWPTTIDDTGEEYYSFHHLSWITEQFRFNCTKGSPRPVVDSPKPSEADSGVFCPPTKYP